MRKSSFLCKRRQGCYRPEKSGKIRENVKKVWNFEICSQFLEIAPISNNCYNFLNIISDVYSQVCSKHVRCCTLNDFNKIIKIYILFSSKFLFHPSFSSITAFFFSKTNLFYAVVWICTQNCILLNFFCLILYNNIN